MPTEITIIIRGEKGVGKNHIADYLKAKLEEALIPTRHVQIGPRDEEPVLEKTSIVIKVE